MKRAVVIGLAGCPLLMALPATGAAHVPAAHAAPPCTISKASFGPTRGTGAFGNVKTRMRVTCSNPAQTWTAYQRVFYLSQRNPPFARSVMPGTGGGVPLPFVTSCRPGERMAAKLVLRVPGQRDIVKRPRHIRCPSSRYGK